MRRVTKQEGQGNIVLEETEIPVPSTTQVLIQMKASLISRGSELWRRYMRQEAVDPAIMGIGPVPAVNKALEKAGMKLDDIDIIEVNEAFAAQILAVERELKWDRSKLNVHGGAIALGHPVGATGAKILTTLLYALRARDKKFGLVSLCIGGGQGVAIVMERLS